MRLTKKVKLYTDTLDWKEVPGEEINIVIDKQPLTIIVHESIQPWTPHVLDISEKSTGCRCTTSNKPVSATTKAEVEKIFQNYIKDVGLDRFLAQIEYKKKTQEPLDKISII